MVNLLQWVTFLMDLGVVDERAIAQHAEESEKNWKR